MSSSSFVSVQQRARLYSISILFASVLLASLLPISAGAEDDFSRDALYVRGGLVVSFDATSIIFTEIDAGYGLGGAVGYRLHPRIALEGQFEWQGNQSASVQGVVTAELSRWDATGNAKIFLATGRVQPYAHVGAGYVSATGVCTSSSSCSASAGSFLVRLGGGLDIYITKNIGVYAEGAYMLATSEILPSESFPDYGTVGAGLIVAF